VTYEYYPDANTPPTLSGFCTLGRHQGFNRKRKLRLEKKITLDGILARVSSICSNPQLSISLSFVHSPLVQFMFGAIGAKRSAPWRPNFSTRFKLIYE